MSPQQTRRLAAQPGISAIRGTRRPFAEIYFELRLFQSYYKLLEIQELHRSLGKSRVDFLGLEGLYFMCDRFSRIFWSVRKSLERCLSFPKKPITA